MPTPIDRNLIDTPIRLITGEQSTRSTQTPVPRRKNLDERSTSSISNSIAKSASPPRNVGIPIPARRTSDGTLLGRASKLSASASPPKHIPARENLANAFSMSSSTLRGVASSSLPRSSATSSTVVAGWNEKATLRASPPKATPLSQTYVHPDNVYSSRSRDNVYTGASPPRSSPAARAAFPRSKATASNKSEGPRPASIAGVAGRHTELSYQDHGASVATGTNSASTLESSEGTRHARPASGTSVKEGKKPHRSPSRGGDHYTDIDSLAHVPRIADISDDESEISLCVSTIAFPPGESDASKEDEIHVELKEFCSRYVNLFKMLCSNRFDEIPEALDAFLAELTHSVEGLRMASGKLCSTQAYCTAEQALLFSKDLLQAHWGKVHRPENSAQTRATSYHLLELTLRNFYNLLHTVVNELDSLEQQERPSDSEISPYISPNGVWPSEELKPQKKGIFDRLRKISSACKGLFDLSASRSPGGLIPPENVLMNPHSSGRAITDELGDFLDDVRSGPTSHNVRDSLELFSSPSPNPAQLNLPIPIENDRDVVWNVDGTLTAATLSQLIRIITDRREILEHDLTDTIDALFLLFRSYVSPHGLLDLLIERYHVEAPDGLQEGHLREWQLYSDFTKIQVANHLSLWLDFYWKDDCDDELFDRITKFTFGTLAKDSGLPSSTSKVVACSLCDCASGRTGPRSRFLEREMQLARDHEETPSVPTVHRFETLPQCDVSLVDVSFFSDKGDAEEIARQLTLIESELWHSFMPEDLVDFDKAILQEKIRKWTMFSNYLTLWVSNCVLGRRDDKSRARLVEFFIQVSMSCRTMRNYSASFAIFSALHSEVIKRLHKTEELVQIKYRQLRNQIYCLFDDTNNWRYYRAEVAQYLPTVPALVVIIKDIEQTRALMDLQQPKLSGKIHMRSCRIMCKIIRDLEKYHVRYNMKRVPFVYEWLERNVLDLQNQVYETLQQRLKEKSFTIEPAAIKPPRQ